jgi:hypothetical protein
METAMQERLNKLLDAYSHSYDIARDVTEEDSSWPATATYYLRDENYCFPNSMFCRQWSSMSISIST